MEPANDDFQQIPVEKTKTELVQNPKVGIFYMTIYVLNQTLNWLSLKYIFI